MALLEQILELTAAIEARVDAGDWPGAAALDRDRRGLLAELLAAQPGGLDRAARGVLEELVVRHRATLGHVEQQRQAIGSALRQLGESPAAMRAYQHAAATPASTPATSALAGSNS